MAENEVEKKVDGQKEEELLMVIEEAPGKGQTVGKTLVLTEDARELAEKGPQKGKTYAVDLTDEKGALKPIKGGKTKLLDVRQNDNPLACFMRNLTNHLDALGTGQNLKYIYVVESSKVGDLVDKLNKRFLPLVKKQLSDMSFSVSKLLKDNQKIERGEAVDPNKVDWKTLEKDFGVKADDLLRSGDMDKLMHFQQSDAVKVTFPPKEGYEQGFDTLARFSLTKDGQVRYTRFSEEVYLDRPFMGHEWTEPEKETLRHDGNLGKTVDLTKKNGEINSYYVSVDPQINQLTLMRADSFKVPKVVGGVELTPVQQNDLKDGKMVFVQGMRRMVDGVPSGRPYDAHVQINADKRGVEYIFDPSLDYKQRFKNTQEYNKKREFDKKVGVPTMKYGKELNEKQRYALAAGQALYVTGCKRKDGKEFNTWLQVNEKGVLKAYSHDPSNINDKVNKAAYGKDAKETQTKTVKKTVTEKVAKTKSKGVKM